MRLLMIGLVDEVTVRPRRIPLSRPDGRLTKRLNEPIAV
jgi:hypothetical protein